MAVARGTASPKHGADTRYLQFKDELHRVVVDVADLSRIDRWSPIRPSPKCSSTPRIKSTSSAAGDWNRSMSPSRTRLTSFA